jgi:hypothetical protein
VEQVEFALRQFHTLAADLDGMPARVETQRTRGEYVAVVDGGAVPQGPADAREQFLDGEGFRYINRRLRGRGPPLYPSRRPAP